MTQQNESIELNNGAVVSSTADLIEQMIQVIEDPKDQDAMIGVLKSWERMGLTHVQMVARLTELGQRVLDERQGQ